MQDNTEDKIKASDDESQNEVVERLHFETILSDISAHFVNLPTDQIDAKIEEAQRRICNYLEVDASSLWQWSKSAPHFMTCTHLYTPPEGPALPPDIDARETVPWVLEKLLAGESLVLSTENKTLEEMERNHLVSVLKQTGWRISGLGGAAGTLGLKRTTLQSKMKKLGIQRPPKSA